jgi:amidase
MRASRAARPAPLEGALWLDEPFASVDATVAAAVLKAALMLAEVGPIVDESARPAFSFGEAWEVFAVLTHALIGAGLPDKARDKLAAREHDFLTGDPSHRAPQARGMRLRTPDFVGIQARRQRLRQEWARFFEHIDVLLCPPAPTGPVRHDHKPDPHARSIEVNRRELRGPHDHRLRHDARSARRRF